MTRGRIVGLWVVLLGLAVAGCAAPQFTYVTNSSQHTYFKVPSGWRQISAGALAAAVNGGSSKPQAGVWTVGYDGSTQPEANHVLGAANQQPFAYSVVAAVNQTTTNELSYNDLRDFFLPVTSAARSTAARSGFPLTNFKLISDSMLELSQGVHGVREIYDYSYPDGSVNTFDQVALTNADDTEVYLLLVHCLASCYSKHQSEIDTVMKSFTVRSP
jgi:hypothetical protein